MEIRCSECASYLENDLQIGKNIGKIRWVVLFNLVMMVVEISTGVFSGSMALSAEGWHMGSHVGALSITLLAYGLAKSPTFARKLSFGAGKLIPLGGYTSAIVLGVVALLLAVESASRMLSPIPIAFNQAIAVACVGLAVNVVSALILHGGHSHGHERHLSVANPANSEAHSDDSHDHDHDAHDHHHDHHDHNIRSAFLHITADAVTSVLAIAALTLGKFYNWYTLDPVIGIVGAIVILSWSVQLCRDTGWELLDGHSKTVDWKKLRSAVESENTKILDFHVWRIAPKAIACELVVATRSSRGLEYYRSLLREQFAVQHVVVEERDWV